MADKTFDLIFTQSVTGGDEVRADIAKTAEMAKSGGAAGNMQVSAGVAALNPELMTAMAAQKDAEAQKNAIALEGEKITRARLDIQAAIAVGEDVEAEKLIREVSIRSAVLAAMKQQTLTQAQQNQLAADEQAVIGLSNQRVEARERELQIAQAQLELNSELIEQEETKQALQRATFEAQEAFNAELIEQEEARQALEEEGSKKSALSRRGIRGILGGLFGETGMAAFGGFFVFELINRQVEKYVESVNKAAEAQMKLNEAKGKFTDESARLNNVNDLQKARAKIEEQINALTSERALKEGDARDEIDSKISALQGEAANLDRMAPVVAQRQENERQIKESLREQQEALDHIAEKYAEMQRQADERLKTEQKIEEIKLGAELAKVARDERDGKISHQQAEESRQGINDKAEKKTFDENQGKITTQIASANKEHDELRDQAAKALADAQQAQQDLLDANAQQAAITSKQNAADLAVKNAATAANDASGIRSEIDSVKDDPHSPGNEPSSMAAMYARLDVANKKADAAIATAQYLQSEAANAAANPPDMKAAKDASDNANKLREDALTKFQDNDKKLTDKIADLQTQLDGVRAEFAAKQDAKKDENTDKVDQAGKHDTVEALQIDKKVNEEKMRQLQEQLRQEELDHTHTRQTHIKEPHVKGQGKPEHVTSGIGAPGDGGKHSTEQQIADLKRKQDEIDLKIIQADPKQKKLAEAIQQDKPPENTPDTQALVKAGSDMGNDPFQMRAYADRVAAATKQIANAHTQIEKNSGIDLLIKVIEDHAKAIGRLDSVQKAQMDKIETLAKKVKTDSP